MIPQIFSYLPLSNFYTRRSCFSQRLTSNDPLTLTPNEKRKDLSCSLGSIYDPETYLLNICTFLKFTWPSRYLWLACPVFIPYSLLLFASHYNQRQRPHKFILYRLPSLFRIRFWFHSQQTSSFYTPPILGPHNITYRVASRFCRFTRTKCVRAHSRMVERVAIPNHNPNAIRVGTTHTHPQTSLAFLPDLFHFLYPPRPLNPLCFRNRLSLFICFVFTTSQSTARIRVYCFS